MHAKVATALLAGLLIASSLQAADAPKAGAQSYREVRWDELVPKDWDPMKDLRAKGLDAMSDADPRMPELMRELRVMWDSAPTNPKLNGAQLKLPGYIVPLESSQGELKEFLLVPYFGACIHTPPPPANQIVHVVLAKPAKGFRSMDAVWVSGSLRTARRDSSMGVSGYGMEGVAVERYAPPAR